MRFRLLPVTPFAYFSRAMDSAPSITGYELGGEIGRGGMAVVFAARHVALDRPCAIKVFDPPECRHRDQLRDRFLVEAKLLSTLRHPGIARVTDAGLLPDGRAWYAVDCEDGPTLAVRLAAPVPPGPDDVARLYVGLRDALAYCHARGVVHGDLKAENILLRPDGSPVLIDFGISRVLDPDLRRRLDLGSATLPVNLGTPYTLAPECRRGERATPASDVYAFGVLLHKLATGLWYEGSPRALEQLPGLAPDWAPFLATMLAENPADRPADATLLPPPPSRRTPFFPAPDPAAPSLSRWRRRRWWIALAIFLLCAFFGYLLERQEQNDRLEELRIIHHAP